MLNYFLDDNTNSYRIDFFDDEAYIYNVKLSDEARQKLAKLIHGKKVYTKLNQNGYEELGCETMTADDFLKICADIDIIQSQHKEGNLPIEMDMSTSWQFKGKMVLSIAYKPFQLPNSFAIHHEKIAYMVFNINPLNDPALVYSENETHDYVANIVQHNQKASR